MPAYVVVDVEVTDPEAYEGYRGLAAAAIERHGGRYLARGGELEPREGDWSPRRLVILEFDSMERARSWYDSDEYREARAAREGAATMNMVFVEGL